VRPGDRTFVGGLAGGRVGHQANRTGQALVCGDVRTGL
jgi:hypothetical protein